QLDESAIFTNDCRVNPLQAAVDCGNLTDQESERIEKVHQHLVDEEALHLAEVRLLHVRFGAAPVTGPHSECGVKDLAAKAVFEHSLNFTKPRLPAPVLV